MLKYALLFFVVALTARAEPPSEPLEGAKIDPQLLSRVKDILLNDGSPASASGNGNGGGNGGGAFPVGRAGPSPNSYAAPSNSYGAPSPQNGGYSRNSFSAAPNGPQKQNGGFSGNGAEPRQGGGFGPGNGLPFPENSGGDLILSDPELAPLLSRFDLSPTFEMRTGPAPGASAFDASAQSQSGRGRGGY